MGVEIGLLEGETEQAEEGEQAAQAETAEPAEQAGQAEEGEQSAQAEPAEHAAQAPLRIAFTNGRGSRRLHLSIHLYDLYFILCFL